MYREVSTKLRILRIVMEEELLLVGASTLLEVGG